MGSKKGKSRWSPREWVKKEERQRRRQEMKDEINREKRERAASSGKHVGPTWHPIPIKYD